MTDSTEPWLVVGLGNPGPAYAGNRHNVGAMVARELAGRHDPSPTFKSHRSRALVDEVRLGSVGGRPGPRAVLAVPTTYMNESGGPVAGLHGVLPRLGGAPRSSSTTSSTCRPRSCA